MVVATGFFDGVHLGHRFLIDRLIGEAHRRGTQSLIVTFWPHPRNVLQNEARDFRLLSSMQEKKALLMEMGVDRVEVLEKEGLDQVYYTAATEDAEHTVCRS